MSNLPAPIPQNLSSVPAFLAGKSSNAGMEWVKATDLTFPRVLVLQPGSPPVKERKASLGDIWHKNEGRVIAPFGQGGVKVTPIRVQQEFIHWASRDSNKGMLGKSTDPASDIAKRARTQRENIKKGIRVDQKKEDSYNESHTWLMWDHDNNAPFVISLSKGNIFESTSLLSSLATKQCDMQGVILALDTKEKTIPQQPSFYAFTFKQVGWCDEPTYTRLKKIADEMAGKEFGAPLEADDVDPHAAATGVAAEVS